MDSFFQPAGDGPEAYLSSGRYVDYEHADIAELSDQLWSQANSREHYARASFEWVRDSIRHPWDAGDSVVSISASDALRNGTGLCYAKAHVHAALLRRKGIPTALCYQRLTHGDGYVIHGLVAVWLLGAWHRQDPRGSTNGTAAEFSLQGEILAWDTDPGAGEVDYSQLFVEPSNEVVTALRRTQRIDQAALPDTLSAA